VGETDETGRDDADETSDTMQCVHCGTPIRYSEDALLCDHCFFDMWFNTDDEYQDDADTWEGTLLKRAAKKTDGSTAR
jgi:hypothetical protein